MQVNVYLSFDGRCRDAFEAYAKLLGGAVEFVQTWGETPAGADMPPEQQDRVMHAQLRIGDRIVFGSDAPPEWRSKPEGFSMSANVTDVEEGRRLFDALAEGGEVKAPYGPTFWSAGFGMLIDRFEIPWMVNCDSAP